MLDKKILRNHRDFSKVYNDGKSTADRYVVVFYIKNGLKYNRKAILASKKIGNAVARNRARRLIKESLRLIGDFDFIGYDIVFIARKTINGKKQKDVENSIKKALSKTAINKEKNKKEIL